MKGDGEEDLQEGKESHAPRGGEEPEPQDDSRERSPASNRPQFGDAEMGVPYHAFTTEFDEIIEADALAPSDELGACSTR